jgi:hypothetical protein
VLDGSFRVKSCPRGIEEICDWTTALLEHACEHATTRIEVTPEAERGWFEHVKEQAQRVLMSKVRSWTTGYSAINRPSTPKYMLYLGGMVRFRRKLTEQASTGYPAFSLSGGGAAGEDSEAARTAAR